MKIESYIAQLEEHFNEKPWFGTSVWSSLEKIPSQYWDARLKHISYSIAELVVHIIDWRGFVVEKMNGNESFHIELNSEQDWRKGISVVSDDEKEVLMSELLASQNQLCQSLGEKSNSWLLEKAAGETYTNEYMIQGIVPHDIYHLGQINLIYKQVKSIENRESLDL